MCISIEERLTSPVQHLSDLSVGNRNVKLVEYISLFLLSKNLSIIHIHNMATFSTSNAN